MKTVPIKGGPSTTTVQVAADAGCSWIDRTERLPPPPPHIIPTNKQELSHPAWRPSRPKSGNRYAGALDNGYFSATNVTSVRKMRVVPYIATAGNAHKDWQYLFSRSSHEPPDVHQSEGQDGYKLQTEIGQAIYRCASVRLNPHRDSRRSWASDNSLGVPGCAAANGAVCLAFNLKRLHILTLKKGSISAPVRPRKGEDPKGEFTLFYAN